MLKDRTCQYCNENFIQIEGRIFSNHVKWCEKNPNSPKNNKKECEICKNLIDPLKYDEHKISCKRKSENVHPCLTCGLVIDGHLKFCNSSCAAIHNNQKRIDSGWSLSTESKNKIRKSVKANMLSIDSPYIGLSCKVEYKKCIVCNAIITRKKLCSTKCYKTHMSILSKINPNCGGETNYKKYSYNGITMDSKWEVEIAHYLDLNNVKWIRSRKIMFLWKDKFGNDRRYYPDFYLPEFNVYLDPKNKYLMIQDEEKIRSVIDINKIELYIGDVKFLKEKIDSLIQNGAIV